ncbi:hypothetical protein [Helicobacter sp. 23-1045]
MSKHSFTKTAFAIFLTGGGILGFLNATELRDICTNTQCNLSVADVTNNGDFSTKVINLTGNVSTFINYGNIKTTDSISIYWNGGEMANFINYGTMSGAIAGSRKNPSYIIMSVTNYGIMGGISTEYGSTDIIIDNRGIINTFTDYGNTYHFAGGNGYSMIFKNYAMIIDESQTTFNAFRQLTFGEKNNSHIVLRYGMGYYRFADSNSKIILDFGNNFEIGKEYSLDKIVVINNSTNKPNADKNGNKWNIDFDRLTTRSSLYQLKQSGNNFIVTIDTANSEIGTLYKSNIRTMNNFDLISNAMIYPHKYKGTNRTTRKRIIRRVRKTANLFDTNQTRHTERSEVSKTHESNEIAETMTKNRIAKDKIKDLALDSNSQSLQDSQDSRIDSSLQQNDSSDFASNDLDSSLTLFAQNDESLFDLVKSNDTFFYKNNSTDSTNQANQTNNRRAVRNPSTNLNTNSNYYFILTPFVNHNYFFESGRYNLSGLEYGFVTAFSGKLNNSNSLGTHFVFSYANLNDKDDSIFNITSMNLNLGLNYKLDLIYAMYLKVRIDGYYFLNEVKSIAIRDKIKPNTIGFGGSIYYGKDWDFNNYGLLGLSGGLDYKGLYANEFIMSNMADSSVFEKYNKQLYNLLYLDLAVDYNKYFNTSVGRWGLNTKLGIKGNITNNALSKSKVFLSNNRSVDMIVDNDKVLGYANISGSYVLNTKDFDMEFSLAYYGNFGDRVMSNGGGFEWRVNW